MTTRHWQFYVDRADHYFEHYLKIQAYIEKVEAEVAEAFLNEGAGSYALKNDQRYWQYREACALRDRDMAIVTMCTGMAMVSDMQSAEGV